MSATAEQVIKTELPTPGTWTLEKAHTTIGATARHLMVTKVRGTFSGFDGRIEIAEKLEDSRADATMDAASIDTHMPARDDHLRSPDFLDVERFPEITFASTKIEPVVKNRFEVTGDFTIRDVTRPLVLDVRYLGSTNGPMGEVAFFSATGEFDREEFGMTWNQALESGGWLVSKKIHIEIEVEAVKS